MSISTAPRTQAGYPTRHRSIRILWGSLAVVTAVALQAPDGLRAQSATETIVADDTTTYHARQGLSYELGSKLAVGYFVPDAGKCQVVLMVGEAFDPTTETQRSFARLRMALRPGDAAGLDSNEGPFIDITCQSRANALVVRRGDRMIGALATN